MFTDILHKIGQMESEEDQPITHDQLAGLSVALGLWFIMVLKSRGIRGQEGCCSF
jgi:hypothetical protein